MYEKTPDKMDYENSNLCELAKVFFVLSNTFICTRAKTGQ